MSLPRHSCNCWVALTPDHYSVAAFAPHTSARHLQALGPEREHTVRILASIDADLDRSADCRADTHVDTDVVIDIGISIETKNTDMNATVWL